MIGAERATVEHEPQAVLSAIVDTSDDARARNLAQLLELAPDCIFAHNLDHRITYWNIAAEKLYGWGRSEAVGQVAYDLLHTQFPTPLNHIRQALMETGAFEGELVHTSRSGARVIVQSRWALQRDEAGAPAMIVEINRDVTARKRSEQALTALNARLKRAMSETHHRIKNNLQVISALIEIQVDAFEHAVPTSSIRSLGSHVKGLAAIHEIITEQTTAGHETSLISARQALGRIMPLLQSNARGRHIQSSVEDLQIPSRQAGALALILNELVSNAGKHGSGDIDITLESDGASARLMVDNEAGGFPADFDPVMSANTGIELVTNLSALDLGGAASFENRPRGSARVTVTFPLAQSESADQQ